MEKGDAEGGDIGTAAEDAEGDDWVFCELPLDDAEEADGEEAKDQEAEDCGGTPGEGRAAVLEAEEEHEGAGNDEEGAEPVDSFDAGYKRCRGGFNVEEKDQYNEGEAIEGKVDVEAWWDYC